jgi:hypothetical protein
MQLVMLLLLLLEVLLIRPLKLLLTFAAFRDSFVLIFAIFRPRIFLDAPLLLKNNTQHFLFVTLITELAR